MKKGDKAYWITSGMVLEVVLLADYRDARMQSFRFEDDAIDTNRHEHSNYIWATEQEATKKAIEFYTMRVNVLKSILKDME